MSKSMLIDLTAPRHLILKANDEIDRILFEANFKGYNVQRKHINKAIKTACIIAAVAATNGFMGEHAYASVIGGTPGIETRIANAFDPIARLMRGMGYPVAMLMETAGALTMFFDKRKGLQIMKNGAIAFLVMNFIPVVLKLLVEVGGAMNVGN